MWGHGITGLRGYVQCTPAGEFRATAKRQEECDGVSEEAGRIGRREKSTDERLRDDITPRKKE